MTDDCSGDRDTLTLTDRKANAAFAKNRIVTLGFRRDDVMNFRGFCRRFDFCLSGV
jgi:hypothetical protein